MGKEVKKKKKNLFFRFRFYRTDTKVNVLLCYDLDPILEYIYS